MHATRIDKSDRTLLINNKIQNLIIDYTLSCHAFEDSKNEFAMGLKHSNGECFFNIFFDR